MYPIALISLVLSLVAGTTSSVRLRHVPHSGTGTASSSRSERTWSENEKRPVPTYLQLLFDHLTSGHPTLGALDTGQGNRTVLQSLLPFKLLHESAIYNLSTLKIPLEDLHSVELVFTLSQNASKFFSSPSARLTLRVRSDSVEQSLDVLWAPDRHFYHVNVTRFITHLPPVDLLKLTFAVSSKAGDEIPIGLLFDLDVNIPFILAHQVELNLSPETVEARISRGRRSPRVSHLRHRGSGDGTGDDSKCHRKEWLVRPDDIGLDDVIAPEIIDLGYCAGYCPFPLLSDVFNFTFHSFFVDTHRIHKAWATPEQLPASRCVAASYQPLMVIEGNTSGHILSIYHNALVHSCGCRY